MSKQKPDKKTIRAILTSALISNSPSLLFTLLGITIAGHLDTRLAEKLQERDRQHAEASLKRDVLQSLAGSRHLLLKPDATGEEEIYIVLNQISVVYANHPEVISARRTLHKDLGVPTRLEVNLLSLTEAMAKAAKVPVDQLDENFFLRPFAPNYSI